MNNIPNKAFDIEYSTMWGREVKFLSSKGIRYSFVKKTKDYGISVFKYKKTPELFLALAEFFTQVENEKSLSAAEKDMHDAISIKTAEELEEAIHSLGLKVVEDNGRPKFIQDGEGTL